MRNRRWVRWGIGSAALAVAGAGAWGTGCSSSTPNLTGPGDSGAGADTAAPPVIDSGTPIPGVDSGSPNDDAGVDSGSVADAGAPPMIALVHAAPDFPPARFCFGLSPAGALAGTEAKPLLPSGLPFGAGGALPIAAANVGLLTSVDLYVWAIPASSINSANDAGQDPAACTVAVTWPGSVLFAMIPKGTIQYNHSYIVVMDGCANPGVDGGATICGSAATNGGTIAYSDAGTTPSGTPLGSLRLEIIGVDNTTVVPADAIGAQFLQLSPSLQALLPAGVIPGITSPEDAGADDAGDDAAPPPPVYDYANITTTPVMYNGAYAGPPGSTVAVPAQTFTGTTVAAASLSTAGIGIRTSTLAVPAPSLASIPFAKVATATLGLTDAGTPQSASALFATGQSYTFIAVGNVGQTPADSSTFFRVIALPSAP
ncbi:MAG: hypothetical protein ACLQVI_17035 [Polyangiaceae bacterium]